MSSNQAGKPQSELLLAMLNYVNGCRLRSGCSPSYREIQRELQIRSLATVSRYMHQLLDSGALPAPEKPARTDARSDAGVHRWRLELADGGHLYLDCRIGGENRLCFDGILDAEGLKGRVSRIVAVYPEPA